MKAIYLMMIVSLFIVTSCGSKKTEAETTMNNEVQQVEATATEAVEEVAAQAEEAVEEATVATTDASASATSCTQGSDERSIEIVEGENPKCEVFYTKNGERTSVARANWDAAYCEKVASQVKGNLETAGFSCN